MNFNRRVFPRLAAALATFAVLGSASAQTADKWTYEVTITNIAYNQQFTPVLVVAHKPDIALFKLGQPASPGLVTLAEEGNVAPLRAVLDASASVASTAAAAGLLDPGKSITLTVRGNPWRDRLSLAAMLIPTNDAFMALNTVGLPAYGGVATYIARAYDAGSEVNDELCSSIPGPSFNECGGSGGGARVGGGEGFVHVHRGVHGVGQLKASARDWRNPVAEVRVRWVR